MIDPAIVRAGVNGSLIGVIEGLKADPLYVGRDSRGWINCSCMTNYCPCEHEGFMAAVALVESWLLAGMSDPSAKV